MQESTAIRNPPTPAEPAQLPPGPPPIGFCGSCNGIMDRHHRGTPDLSRCARAQGRTRTGPTRRQAIWNGDHTLQSVIAIEASWNAGKDRPAATRASPRFPSDSRRFPSPWTGRIRTLPLRRHAIREGDHTLQSVIAIGASWNVGKDLPPAPRACPRLPSDSRRCPPGTGRIRTLPPRRHAIRDGDHTLQSVIAIEASLNAGTDRPPEPNASPRLPTLALRFEAVSLPMDGAHPDAAPRHAGPRSQDSFGKARESTPRMGVVSKCAQTEGFPICGLSSGQIARYGPRPRTWPDWCST